jgi:hypothetical protein
MLNRLAAKRKFFALLRTGPFGCCYRVCLVGGRRPGGFRSKRPIGEYRLCFFGSGWGMAAGGWLAGILYDHFGFYAPAFAAGFGVNLFNFAVIGTLASTQPNRRGVSAFNAPKRLRSLQRAAPAMSRTR